MPALRYVRDRWKTLKPSLNYFDEWDNPIGLVRSLRWRQWGYFLVGLLAWIWDAFDFHTVTITYDELSKTFHKAPTQISVGVTLVLMVRPLGAAIFGLAADYCGRRIPFIVICSLLSIFELATGFCQTYEQFLAVRALFGFAMGGMYGNAAATALEDVPDAAKGLMSGIFQSGYPLGYLLAVVFWAAFDGRTAHGWKALFWFGAAPPILLIIARWKMKETKSFRDKKPLDESRPDVAEVVEDTVYAWRENWKLLLYLSVLMTGFSYMSHGTQDLFPLMLQHKYGFNSRSITRVQVTANIGGFVGGTLVGYFSQMVGRRFTIILMCGLGGALLYPYTSSSGPGLYAAVFFEQFCVQGAFGVVPIYLLELSPPAFRTFVVGTTYNIGVFVASASNSIETAIGEHYPLPSRDGTRIYDYSFVICVVAACVFACVALIASLGPEKERGAILKKDNTGDSQPTDTSEQLELSPSRSVIV